MSQRNKLAAIKIAAALLAVIGTDAHAANVRVSCTENNTLIHREDVARESLDQKRADIADRYPSAFCVFLEPPSENEASSNGTVVIGEPNITAGATDDLMTALAAITNKTNPDRIGETVPASFSQRFGDVQSKKETKSKLGLAIGIYNDVPPSTVLSHWRTAAADTNWLARMTPTITSAGNVTMLSIDGVKDDDVGQVCAEVEDRGLKCLAAY